MRKLRPRRGRGWLFTPVFLEPRKAPVWIGICECYRTAGAGNLRLVAWNLKAGPVLKARGAQKSHFLLKTLRGGQTLPGGSWSLGQPNKMHVAMREIRLDQHSGRSLGTW